MLPPYVILPEDSTDICFFKWYRTKKSFQIPIGLMESYSYMYLSLYDVDR